MGADCQHLLAHHQGILSVDQPGHKYYIPQLPYYLCFHVNGFISTTEGTVLRPLSDIEHTPV